MQAQVAPQFEVVHNALANLVAELLSNIEQAGTVKAKLALALLAEQEVTTALETITPILQAARNAAVERAGALRTELRTAAVAEVVAMLGEGAITLEALATQAGVKVAVQGNMTFERVAPQTACPDVVADAVVEVVAKPAEVATPAPAAAAPAAAAQVAAAPVVQPLVDANGAKLAPDVRENLRMQAAYMNPVKFRDPTSGAGWSGRGPMPKWLKALVVGGKTVEDFRVGGVAPGVAAASEAEAPSEGVEAADTAPVVEALAPAAERDAAPAPAPADDAAVAAVAADCLDIGEVVGAFDARDLDSDLDSGPESSVDSAANGGADESDIGEVVATFDASGLDVDLGSAPNADDADIGEIVDSIAAMENLGALGSASNVATFLAAA